MYVVYILLFCFIYNMHILYIYASKVDLVCYIACYYYMAGMRFVAS